MVLGNNWMMIEKSPKTVTVPQMARKDRIQYRDSAKLIRDRIQITEYKDQR
jgi:hypothetical protein